MAFGLANVCGAAVSMAYPEDRAFRLAAGLLVGGIWFGFGMYGGLPLVATVRDWHAPVAPEVVTEKVWEGLLVMRRRRWVMWSSFVGVFVTAPLVVGALVQAGQGGLWVLLVGAPLAVVTFRYGLSRCPRCGYGFFARSTSRAATLAFGRSCRQCGLSLYAYQER